MRLGLCLTGWPCRCSASAGRRVAHTCRVAGQRPRLRPYPSLLQVYETYSRTCQNLTALGQDPAAYLEAWSNRYYNGAIPGCAVISAASPPYLISHRLIAGWLVPFSDDPSVGWPSQVVNLAPSQFVIALANGWADGVRSVLIMPQKVRASLVVCVCARARQRAPRNLSRRCYQAGEAYGALNVSAEGVGAAPNFLRQFSTFSQLPPSSRCQCPHVQASGVPPRGFVYWDISQEGYIPQGQTQPLFMAAGINSFLHTRS